MSPPFGVDVDQVLFLVLAHSCDVLFAVLYHVVVKPQLLFTHIEIGGRVFSAHPLCSAKKLLSTSAIVYCWLSMTNGMVIIVWSI
jgi:hypothetical protein